MCRSKAAGGRRCPGCVGTGARDAHNARRRHNRKVRRQIRSFMHEQDFAPAIVDHVEGLPIDQAKAWVIDRGVAPADLQAGADVSRLRLRRSGHSEEDASSSAHYSSGGSDGELWGDSWRHAGEDVHDSIARLQAEQGTRPGEAELLGKQVRSMSPVAGGTNITNVVVFEDETSSYHKPFSGLRVGLARSFGQDGPLQSIHEVAAYRFAHELGEPYRTMVPPTVLREIDGELGSLQKDAAGKQHAGSVRELSGWQHAAFYDALIGQQDRHGGNYRVTDDGHIRLIDHGYSFRREDDYENASDFKLMRALDEPALTADELRICRRVIDSPDTLGMRGVLEPDRVQAIRDRAQQMLDTQEIDGAEQARKLKALIEENRQRAAEAARAWAERNKAR